MHLLLVNTNAAFSGAERVLARVAEVALEAGHEVSLVAPSGPVVEKFPDGVRHVAIGELNLRGRRDPAALAGFARAVLHSGRVLRRESSSHTISVLNNANAILLSPFARGRVVLFLHDVLSPRRGWLYSRLSRSANRVVAVSDSAARSVQPGVEIVVAHNGTVIPDEDSVETAERGRDAGPLVIGMLAAITPWKGHHVLIRAFAQIAEAQNAIVELAGEPFPGDEAYLDELESLVAGFGLESRVRFLGQVDAEEALKRWSVVVSPSLAPEAMGLSLLEGMAWGCVVMSSDHGEPVTFLANGAGVLVAAGNVEAWAIALERVLGDPELRDDLARAARERVLQFEVVTSTQAQLRALTLT